MLATGVIVVPDAAGVELVEEASCEAASAVSPAGVLLLAVLVCGSLLGVLEDALADALTWAAAVLPDWSEVEDSCEAASEACGSAVSESAAPSCSGAEAVVEPPEALPVDAPAWSVPAVPEAVPSPEPVVVLSSASEGVSPPPFVVVLVAMVAAASSCWDSPASRSRMAYRQVVYQPMPSASERATKKTTSSAMRRPWPVAGRCGRAPSTWVSCVPVEGCPPLARLALLSGVGVACPAPPASCAPSCAESAPTSPCATSAPASAEARSAADW